MVAFAQARGLIIAAPSSGSGKTIVTLGILSALKNQGVRVTAMKSGPDYIDPAFHALATERPCLNIDPWAMRDSTLAASLDEAKSGADMVIVEGVMGLFDGATLDEGSTADIAKRTGWPVVLVVDSRSQGASAAAQVLGHHMYRDDINIAGVIFNRVGSQKHQNVIRKAMARVVPDVLVLGMIPWQGDLELPSRHLGLVQAAEHQQLCDIMARAATCVECHVDLKSLQHLACIPNASQEFHDVPLMPIPPLGQHIAVAQDEAFAFTYPAILQGWKNQGAEISFFSPLENEAPAAFADAVFLPGGYPELHGYRLASAENFITGMQTAAQNGKIIYGECGGYMTLGESIEDAAGTKHQMLGLLPLETSFAKRKLHLGYRQFTTLTETPLGPVRTKFRGHEFHYVRTIHEGTAAKLFAAKDTENTNLEDAGLVVNTVFGSFAHLIDRA